MFRMTQYRASLKEMYRELTGMCCKPDGELLQVRKGGAHPQREKHSFRRVAVTLECSLLKLTLSGGMVLLDALYCISPVP